MASSEKATGSRIPGLLALLKRAELFERLQETEQWCVDSRVRSVRDLHEDENLARYLQLDFYEARRLRKALADEFQLNSWAQSPPMEADSRVGGGTLREAIPKEWDTPEEHSAGLVAACTSQWRMGVTS